MDSSRFDELTKALASATSRRQALQRIGGVLTGGLLASSPLGQVLAKGGGNSACAHFCDAVFGTDTPAASQCISEAAHGKGLCHQCGSAAPSSICCARNAAGYCSSYTSAHCPCDACSTCQNGTCVDACGSGDYCSNGLCCPFADTNCHGACCATFAGFQCCSDGTCCPPASAGFFCCANGGCCNNLT